MKSSPEPRSSEYGNARQSRRSCKSKICGVPLWILSIVLLVVVTAIVVPIAVMFGRKKNNTPRSDVLVPLYVYPSPGAWDPLFEA